LTNDLSLRKTLISLLVKEEEYSVALEEMTFLSSDVFENIFNKVILLLKMKREEDALLEVENAILLKPVENKELVGIKLQLLLNLEKYDQLLDILFLNLKEILGQYKMIEEFFGKEKAFELASELIVKIFKVGQASDQHENVIKKLLDCKFVVKNILFLMTLADFCFKNGFFGYAQNIYGYLEELFSSDPRVLSKIYCSNAKIYLMIGDREYGLRLLKQAVLINPSLSAAWQMLCEESLRAQQFNAAELFLKKARSLNPFDQNLLFLKEQIHFARIYCL
jgi:tetratricopeptide (TPR) repeat protein